MLRVVIRAMVPVLLLAGGLALLLYGALGSSVAVVAEHEEQRTIETSPRILPPPPAPPLAFPGLPGLRQPPPPMPSPPPIRKTVTFQVFTAIDTREPELVREITFGGVTRLANGELKRTYTGKAPALCPT